MVSDQVRQTLAGYAEGTPVSDDEAVSIYKDKLAEVESRRSDYASLGNVESNDEIALSMAKTEINQSERTFSGGEEMNLSILALGQRGVQEGWGSDDDTVVRSYGFARGPFGDDDQPKAARCVFINNRANGVDLSHVRSSFTPLNTLRGNYSVEESDLDGVYVCRTTDDTVLTETDLDSLPSDDEGKYGIIQQAVPEATLSTLGDNLSSRDPDSGYARAFGADLRRVTGQLVGYHIADDHSFGVYTLADETVTVDDIEQSDLVKGEIRGAPGLTVWTDPDYHMEWGEGSRVEVIGTVRTDDSGQIVMDCAGIIPLVPEPMEGSSDGSVNSTTEEIA